MTSPFSDSSSRSPKLLNQLRARIRVKHYSIRTEQANVQWFKRYLFFGGMVRHDFCAGSCTVNLCIPSIHCCLSKALAQPSKRSFQMFLRRFTQSFPQFKRLATYCQHIRQRRFAEQFLIGM